MTIYWDKSSVNCLGAIIEWNEGYLNTSSATLTTFVDLKTKTGPKWLTGGVPCSMERMGKGILLGGLEPGNPGFHHVTQNGVQFKAPESFVAGIFHLDCDWPQVTSTTESKVVVKGGGGYCSFDFRMKEGRLLSPVFACREQMSGSARLKSWDSSCPARDPDKRHSLLSQER